MANPPPSFSDFKFTTIGQPPQLLKRFSAPLTPDCHHDSTTPPLLRPTLLQALAPSEHTTPSSNTNIIIEPTTPYVSSTPSNPPLHRGSSYAVLRALQSRLIASLSEIHPPVTNENDALLLVQAANYNAATSLTTAHRSNMLAQQSLASAKEAVTAAQECLDASEKAKAHASDALAAVKKLNSSNTVLDVDGRVYWHWEAKVNKLQDDLRLLGEWIAEKENEEAVKRLDANRYEPRIIERTMTVARDSGVDPHIVRATELEASKRAHEKQGESAGARLEPKSGRRSTAELEADDAMRSWSLERDHNMNTMGVAPMQGDVDIAQHLPPEPSEEISPPHLSKSKAGQPGETSHLPPLSRAQEDELPSQAVQGDEARIPESQEKKFGGGSFQTMQRDHSSGSTSHDFLPANQTHLAADQSQQSRPKDSTTVEEAKERVDAFAVGLEQKRADIRHLLLQKRAQELAEMKKKEEEKALEQERLATVKEQELLAEQGRRRQEVMAQKQRATAETAARINAERARERERKVGISIESTPASSRLPPVDNSDSLTKETADRKTAKKTISLSGNARSLGSSPVPTGPAAMRQRSSKSNTPIGKTDTDHKPPPSKLMGDAPRKASPSMLSPSRSLLEASHTPPFSGAEDLHVYRHSDDPGNMCVVSCSQVYPASPEAQAANLRFVRDYNDVRMESKVSLNKPKPTVKSESPSPVPLVRPPNEPFPVPPPGDTTDSPKSTMKALSSPPNPTPVKPYPLPSVSSVQRLATRVSTKTAPSSTPQSTGSSTIALPPTQPTKPIDSKHPARSDQAISQVEIKTNINAPNTVLSQTPLHATTVTANKSNDLHNSSDDVHQLPSIIHSDSGCARPGDAKVDVSGVNIKQIEQTTEQQRQGPHHHSSPPPLSDNRRPSPSWSPITRSPRSPAPRSPTLGKKRYREDYLEDQPPARRQRPMDKIQGPRSPSPPRGPTHWRSTPPRQSTSTDLHARVQGPIFRDAPPRRPLPERQLVWRSPSAEPSALQARIGNRGSATESNYRPDYRSGNTHDRLQSRDRFDSYRPVQSDRSYTPIDSRYNSAQRFDSEPRAPSHNHGRGTMSMSNSRGTPRGRGDRAGGRPLNLQHRISSNKTLIHRLESPPPRNF